MKQLQFFWLISIPVILFSSCTKGPGEGGTSTIKGKVYAYNYDVLGQLTGQYFAPEEHVYIVFGDDGYYSIDNKTGYDGTYEFPYLKKGHYTIYAYSKCTTCPSGYEPVFIQADVTSNNSVVELDTLIINR